MNLKGRNKITPEFSMSSMTDIVFLLLIFFMIASTLAKQLNTIDIKLPEAKGKTENRNTVNVTINNNSHFYINSKRVSRAKVRNELLTELNQSESKSIVLRAEKKVPIDEVVYVMDLANKNGIKVVLAVDSK
ncbi:MAG: biopolymer transporter ExbD [Flavobacteriaceae bacterium]|nr:biopolymer transporter ExbD [Flavobacteriaceae bacterium]|tara:strand:- start:81 stop:476 length:396 start_codon:yes stop_codon:yes gene_type:complete